MPPALYLRDVGELAAGSGLSLGIQNIARWDSGAYTGEVSASMARDLGCHYALVGHSERRQLFAEDEQVIADKVGQVLASGLTLMLCVGETLDQRSNAEAVVRAQVRSALEAIAPESWNRVVIAYEPVWAIGTGHTATAEDAQRMHGDIRQLLADMGAPADKVPLLYGGSVKPDNAAALFSQPDIDGGLIGGASLKADDFMEICRGA